MRVPQLRLAALALTSAIALSGCAYGMYDDGYGYGGYGPYSGSGVSIGIGYGSGYGGYGYGSGYGGYGYGYPYGGYYGGYDPFGWYGDYYYPGTGIYVYDVYRRPHVWSDSQRRYWVSRRPAVTTTTKTTVIKPNWDGFKRDIRDRTVRTSRVTLDRPSRSERLQQVQERRSERATTRSSRQRGRTTSQDD